MSDLLKDPLDFGTQLAENERKNLVERIQDKVIPQQVKGADGAWPHPECDDCGEDIDPKRLEATGSKLCISCAQLKELREKGYA